MIMDQKKVTEYTIFTHGLLSGIMMMSFTVGRDGVSLEDFMPFLIDRVKHLPGVILERTSDVYKRG